MVGLVVVVVVALCIVGAMVVKGGRVLLDVLLGDGVGGAVGRFVLGKLVVGHIVVGPTVVGRVVVLDRVGLIVVGASVGMLVGMAVVGMGVVGASVGYIHCRIVR